MAMLDETLDDWGTARLTLNRPERHNAFNAELIAARHMLARSLFKARSAW